jgi:hypothetical protein
MTAWLGCAVIVTAGCVPAVDLERRIEDGEEEDEEVTAGM